MTITIHAFVDGGCSPNPGEMGAGAVLLALGKGRVLREGHFAKYYAKGTNQEAELQAILLAIDSIEPKRRENISLTIFSDSEWAVNKVVKKYGGETYQATVNVINQRSKDFASFAIYHVAKAKKGTDIGDHLVTAHNLAHKAINTKGEYKNIREYKEELF